MITVYFIRGEEKIPVQVDEGMTLMEAARDYATQSIEEIPADLALTPISFPTFVAACLDPVFPDRISDSRLDAETIVFPSSSLII